MMRRARHLLQVALVATLVAITWVLPTAGPVAAAGHLELVSQTVELAPKGTLDLTVKVPTGVSLASLKDFTLIVTAYRPVGTRAAVNDAVDGRLPRSVDSVDVLAADMTRIGTDRLRARVPLETTTRTPGALQLSAPGLYPITLELVTRGTLAADLVSFVHRVPGVTDPPEDPLQVAMAVSTTAAVTLGDDAQVVIDPAVLHDLTTLATVLEASSVPVSVRVPPALLTALADAGADAAALGNRLSAALQHHNLLSSPSLPLDPSAAAAAGEQALYTQWLRDGEDALSRATANPSQRTIAFVDEPLSQAGGALLRDLGGRMLVMPVSLYDTLPDTLAGFTDTTQLVQIQVAPDTTIDAAIIDRQASVALQHASVTPFLDSVYLVADLLAARQQIVDEGLDPRRHGITLATPDLSAPAADLMKSFTRLLANTSGLRPTTLDDLSVRTDPLLNDGRPAVVGLPPTAGADIKPRIDQTHQLALEGASTSSMLPSDDPRVAQWNQLIGSMPSSALTDAQAARITDRLHADYLAVRSSVTVPTGFSFNLTGRTGTVPVNLRNNAPIPLKVRVRMNSSKLLFPAGDQTVTLAPEAFTEVRIPIEARSNGSFPVSLDVFTPLGDVSLTPAVPLTASVRAMSGLGNLVTGAALLVLFTWWVRHARRNRRRRAAAAAADRHPVLGSGASIDDSGLSPDAATSTLPPS